MPYSLRAVSWLRASLAALEKQSINKLSNLELWRGRLECSVGSSGAPGNVPAVAQQAGANPFGGIELLKGHLGTGCDGMGCGPLTYLKVQGCMPLALGDKR